MPQGLSVDLPYPTTDNIEPDECSLKIISPAYATSEGELRAILQYSYQVAVFNKLGYSEYADTIEQISITEMMHLEMLANMIINLGALPIYTAQPPCYNNFFNTCPINYTSYPQRMIMADIEGEEGAIKMYTCMLEKLKNEKVASVIARILMDEKLHLETLKKILNELIYENR